MDFCFFAGLLPDGKATLGRPLVIQRHPTISENEVIKSSTTTRATPSKLSGAARWPHPDAEFHRVFAAVHFMGGRSPARRAERRFINRSLPTWPAGCSMADRTAPDQLEDVGLGRLEAMGIRIPPAPNPAERVVPVTLYINSAASN